MAEPLVIVGAGGFGRETIDVVDAMASASDSPPYELLGVLDDAPSLTNLELLDRRGVPYLGALDGGRLQGQSCRYLVGVGSPGARRRIAELMDAAGHRPATAIHPTATRGADVSIAEGSIICAGVRTTNNIVIGRHVHLNLNVTVGHDVVIGDYVSVNPLVAISGGCSIGPGTMFGTGSVILQGLRTGADSVVGASACVVRDVAESTTVKGVPAR